MKKSHYGSQLPAAIRFISKVKIGTRLMILWVLFLCAVAIPVSMLLIEFNRSMNTYNDVLKNLENIRYIMSATEDQGDRILGYCVVRKNIEESGETEIIVTMQNKLAQIEKNLGGDEQYRENSEKFSIIKNLFNSYVQDYKEGVGLCDDNFSLMAASKFYSMMNTSNYISKNCNAFLSLELKRSADLREQTAADVSAKILIALIVSIVIIIITSLLSIAIQVSIVTPVNLLKKKISIVADGDLAEPDIHLGTKDELHDVSTAFNTMKNNLTNILENVRSVSVEMDSSVSTVTERAEDNSSRSDSIARAMDDVMRNMERTHENINDIEGVSARISESAAKIRENAERSLQDSKTGNATLAMYSSQLREVNSVMSELSTAAHDLSASTEEMNMMVQDITDIARQTNILSINASIEAARSGDYGKGFSVVAQEIGNLAANSNDSAKQIEEIIMHVQANARDMEQKMMAGLEQIDKGNAIAQNIVKNFDNIQDGILLVNNSVKDISVDISELLQFVSMISKNVDMIYSSADDSTSVTTQIVNSIHEEGVNLKEVTRIMEELSQTAKQLESTVAQFTL